MAVADATLDALEAAGIAAVDGEWRRAGYAAVRWPGRLELVEVAGREVLLDGAHNPAGAATSGRGARRSGPVPARPAGRRSCSRSWPTRTWTESWGRWAVAPIWRGARVICTAPAVARALPAEELAARWLAVTGRPAEAIPEPAAALEAALSGGSGPGRADGRDWGPGGAVIVAGSLYLVGAARALLVDDPLPRARSAAAPEGGRPMSHPRDDHSADAYRRASVRVGQPDVRHGHRERDPRLVLRRRPPGDRRGSPRSRRRGRRCPGPPHGGGRRGHPRRRRRVHSTGPRARARGRGAGPRRAGRRRDPRRPCRTCRSASTRPSRPSRRRRSTPERSLLNDVWGVSPDDAMARLAAARGVPLIVMHNRAEPDYRDLVAEVVADLRAALERAMAAGRPAREPDRRPGLRLREDARAQPAGPARAAGAPRARASRSCSAPPASPRWAASSAASRRRTGSKRPWPRPRSASPPGSTSCAFTTFGPTSGPPVSPTPSSEEACHVTRSHRPDEHAVRGPARRRWRRSAPRPSRSRWTSSSILDLRPAGRADDLALTVDYRDVFGSAGRSSRARASG